MHDFRQEWDNVVVCLWTLSISSAFITLRTLEISVDEGHGVTSLVLQLKVPGEEAPANG